MIVQRSGRSRHQGPTPLTAFLPRLSRSQITSPAASWPDSPGRLLVVVKLTGPGPSAASRHTGVPGRAASDQLEAADSRPSDYHIGPQRGQ